MMAKSFEKDWALDLVTPEPDGIPRFDIVRRDGTRAENDIFLRLSSEVLQNPTLLAAAFVNTFLDREAESRELFPKIKYRHIGNYDAGEPFLIPMSGFDEELEYGNIGIAQIGDRDRVAIGDRHGKADSIATASMLRNLTVGGTSWSPRVAANAFGWQGVAYGDVPYENLIVDDDGNVIVEEGSGIFVAVANSGGSGEAARNRIMVSQDAVEWESALTPAASPQVHYGWMSVTYGNGIFVAVANAGGTATGAFTALNRIMTSPDGITWTLRQAPIIAAWSSVTYANGMFVAVASGVTTGAAFPGITTRHKVMTSIDGITWTARECPPTSPAAPAVSNHAWREVCYGGGQFVAVASAGGTPTTARVMTSPDGIVWTIREAAAPLAWWSVTYGDGMFVAVSDSGGNFTNAIMTSPDGIVWTARVAPVRNNWHSVTWGDGTFVVIGRGGGNLTNRVMTSPDGIAWIIRAAANANQWRGLCYGDDLFVAVANAGGTLANRVMTSHAPLIPPF